jgi:hypothetical protein
MPSGRELAVGQVAYPRSAQVIDPDRDWTSLRKGQLQPRPWRRIPAGHAQAHLGRGRGIVRRQRAGAHFEHRRQIRAHDFASVERDEIEDAWVASTVFVRLVLTTSDQVARRSFGT